MVCSLNGNIILEGTNTAGADKGDKLILDGTDGSASNAGDDLNLEAQSSTATAGLSLRIKYEHGTNKMHLESVHGWCKDKNSRRHDST